MLDFYTKTVIGLFISYGIGSLSTAVIICRVLGLGDPREQGSGNPGATNVLRVGGKTAALITLLGDALKGVLPVLVAKLAGFNGISLGLIAFAAFLGHLYPLFFRFKGGKGVATALGCWLALSWQVGVSLLLTWISVCVITRYSSVAALLTALLAPFYVWSFTHSLSFTIMGSLMSLLLIYRHKKNISNLAQGKETRVGFSKTKKKYPTKTTGGE